MTTQLKRFPLWSPHAPLAIALAALVFGFDQSHKWWMLSVYDIANRQPVPLSSFFELVLVWNRGISYGLLPTHLQGLAYCRKPDRLPHPVELGLPLAITSHHCRPCHHHRRSLVQRA